MGASKTYRGAPGWQEKNTNRGKESPYSKGNIANPEGTHMSGGAELRKGQKSGAGKSNSHRAPGRNSGPYGKS